MRAIVQGGSVIASLGERILGRTTAEDIINASTDEVIVKAGTLIDEPMVKLIEDAEVQSAKIRSPLVCEAAQGVCGTCYGRDLARGTPVNIGEAVGVIAAQSIGEPGTQLTMRTFHIGGTVNTSVEESETRAKRGGIVRFTRMRVVRTEEGKDIVLTRNGEISLLDPKGREIEKYEVPTGATYKNLNVRYL